MRPRQRVIPALNAERPNGAGRAGYQGPSTEDDGRGRGGQRTPENENEKYELPFHRKGSPYKTKVGHA